MVTLAEAYPAYETLDSGKRQEFDTGAKRDTQDGKPRYDLVPIASLKRLAELYARGSEKYSEGNWVKGMPYSRIYSSMYRHMIQWAEGDTSEDHLAAVAWNAFALMHFDSTNRTELDDMDKLRK